MVVALGLDIRVGHEKHGEDNRDNIPSRQNQAWEGTSDTRSGRPEGGQPT